MNNVNIANWIDCSVISNYDEMSRRISRYHGPLVILQRVCDGVIRGYQRYILSRFEKEKQDVFFAFPDYIYGHCVYSGISEYQKYLHIYRLSRYVLNANFSRDYQSNAYYFLAIMNYYFQYFIIFPIHAR